MERDAARTRWLRLAIAYAVTLNVMVVAWLVSDRLEDCLWPFALVAVFGGVAAVRRPAVIAKAIAASFVGWGLVTLLSLRGEALVYGGLYFSLISGMQIAGLIVGLWGFGMRATAPRSGRQER